MNTAKAWYWIALGIFALGLSNEYQNGGLPVLHQVADRTETVLCRIVGRAEQSLAMARVIMESPRQEFATDELFVVQRQVDLARAQAKLDRMRAIMERARADQVRVLQRQSSYLSRASERRVVVVCPKTGKQIEVEMPDLSGLDSEIRKMQVDDTF
jgi:uncharacterized protein (DUF2252 family)